MPAEKGKSILFIAISLALVAGSFAALSYVRTYSKSIEPSNFRSFAVSGEGKVVAKPDIAAFTFSIISQGDKEIAKLQQENTERTNRAISLLKEKGVDASDIKTESYSVEPRYQYYSCPPILESGSSRPCPPAEITGYTISQTISVKIRKFDAIGDVVSGVVSAGANSVSQLSFTVDDPAALENQARTEAIKKAQEKAKEIAKAGNFRLGRLLSIDEGGYYPPIYYARTESVAMGKGGDVMPAPTPAIEPGSQDIRINIMLNYEIE